MTEETKTETQTNRPVLPNVEELLNSMRKAQSAAFDIQKSATISVENIDVSLNAIEHMEAYLKEFHDGQLSMIESRAKTDSANLKELVSAQSERLKSMRSVLSTARQVFTDEEYAVTKPMALPLASSMERLRVVGTSSTNE